MSDQQQRLLQSAQARYGTIYPCYGKADWTECFTQEFGQVILWFNSTDNSTHIQTDSEK